MKKAVILLIFAVLLVTSQAQANPPIYIAFHWHMHQPIYFPYQRVTQTSDSGVYGFDVLGVHFDRTGSYTSWPMDAVRAGMDGGLPHLGAQVSFSGSLMENLDTISSEGRGFANWNGYWRTASDWKTTLNNQRLEIVKFGYHHPLMPLVDHRDIVLQIQMHNLAVEQHFGSDAAASKGIFPPETGFAEWIIPALRETGIEWVLIDNIHFDRSRTDYPYSSGSNLVPPNPADQQNTDGDINWIQLNGIWAGSQVGAPWGYQPHYVSYIDPDTGEESKIIAVPAARYEGNEDARGGFGALQYEAVLSQYEQYNTDDNHPMLIVLHHDGDNYGGGTESYYHSNFYNFVSWLQANPNRFICTTVQDYLDQFPPDQNDIIHVEPGSWSGADNGDAEFQKWNGDPDDSSYSPDRVSWAAVTAARNHVQTAESIQGVNSISALIDGSGNNTEKAYRFLLNAETSCYWYWDNSEDGLWDSHPSRACNEAVSLANQVIGTNSNDTVPPTIYSPQRQPYNPGGTEWGQETQPSDFAVWTLVYDISGLNRVILRYRIDPDGTVDHDNLLRQGGQWQEITMSSSTLSTNINPAPTVLANYYEATITGQSQKLIDYYVEAEDGQGNIEKSHIMHVYVGERAGGPGPGPEGVHWVPSSPCRTEPFKVFSPDPGKLHWATNDWQLADESCWPESTAIFGDGPAVESDFSGPDENGNYFVQFGTLDGAPSEITAIDFVIHRADDSWDNNNGNDYHITIGNTCEPATPDQPEYEPPDTSEQGDTSIPPDTAPDTGRPDVVQDTMTGDSDHTDVFQDPQTPDQNNFDNPFTQDHGQIDTQTTPSEADSEDTVYDGCGCNSSRQTGGLWIFFAFLFLLILEHKSRQRKHNKKQ